ncbi:MAG: RNA-binding protein [Simkaniaceae bacterium]|nr:RNA-binding protein [Candidatus Sacchlamyda saccharinae]
MANSKKLYVGNISYDLGNEELKETFQAYGDVESAQVIMDRDSGRSKGFGFVEMANEEQAQAAIDALDGNEISGRKLTVNEARPQTDRAGRGGGGGGRRY